MSNKLSNADLRILRDIKNWWTQHRAELLNRKPFRRARVISSTSGSFDVRMVKTDGDDGTAEAVNTYRYAVYRLDGETLIEANVQLNVGARHYYETFDLGTVKPATFGRAIYDQIDDESETTFKIIWCNEFQSREVCDTGDSAPIDP